MFISDHDKDLKLNITSAWNNKHYEEMLIEHCAITRWVEATIGLLLI